MWRAFGISFLVMLLLCAGGFGAWYFFLRAPSVVMDFSAAGAAPAGAGAAHVPPGREAPAGAKEYHNSTYGISLFYPDNYSVKEFPGQDGSMTITFEYLDSKVASGFQLFVAPFAGTQITDERFKKDEPSGVREGVQNVTVGGAPGASFFSQDKILGATYEVWFIRGGYLYEMTSFKELKDMLDAVASSTVFF